MKARGTYFMNDKQIAVQEPRTMRRPTASELQDSRECGIITDDRPIPLPIQPRHIQQEQDSDFYPFN